jgi:hypothetical protein
MTSEPLVLTRHPPHDKCVDSAKVVAKLTGVEATIIAHPTREDWADLFCNVFQFKVTALMHAPPSYAESYSLGGLLTDHPSFPEQSAPFNNFDAIVPDGQPTVRYCRGGGDAARPRYRCRQATNAAVRSIASPPPASVHEARQNDQPRAACTSSKNAATISAGQQLVLPQ